MEPESDAPSTIPESSVNVEEEDIHIGSSSCCMMSTTWTLVYTAIALLIVHQLYSFTFFRRIGIAGPTPLPLLGNLLSLKSGFLLACDRWSKQYGATYGLYMGTKSIIFSTDLELAKQVLIKDFSVFNSRGSESIQMKYISDSLVGQAGEEWKKSRTLISPTFSGSKMKQMVPSLNCNCDTLIEVLDKINAKGDSFDAKEVFGSFVMDCVASCAFGIQADCQRNSDDPFVKHAKKFIDPNLFNPAKLAAMMAPSLLPVLSFFGIEMFPKTTTDFFSDIVKRAMELKKDDSVENKRQDFLQLMMDAMATGDDDHDESTSLGDGKDGDVSTHHHGNAANKKTPQTIDALMGHSMIFFLAGYETVATALSFVAYAMAVNPEIQTKVQEEIDEMSPAGEPIEYDVISKMEYLDKVWCETLRMWPFATVLKRQSTKPYSFNGVDIPDKQFLFFNVWAIHHDPELWPEPFTFDPERFTKEAKESRHLCAYMPFGNGPRNCVGMRFANLEAKMAIVRMLQKYSFDTEPDTKDMTKLENIGKMMLYPEKGIKLRSVLRN